MRGTTHLTIGILTTIEASVLSQRPLNFLTFAVAVVCSLIPDMDSANSTISNTILNHKTSKFIYRCFLYAINLLIFFIAMSINKNLFFSSIVTFIAIVIVDLKLKHDFLRKILLSSLCLTMGYVLYIIKLPIAFILLSALLALFPWLKHRGISHSIVAVVLTYIILKQIEIITYIEDLAFFGCIGYMSHLFLGDIFTKMGIPIFYPLSNKKISLGFLKVGNFFSNTLEVFYVLILLLIVFYTFKIYV